MERLKTALAICLLFLVGITGVFAQGVTTSSIRGKVVGTDGSPLSPANVVAVHTPSGTQYGTITREDGNFNMQNMRIGGPYKVVISFVGYQTQEFTDIQLALGVTYDLEAELVTESTALEEVMVVGAQRDAVISKDRTGPATNIAARELTRLPSITRSSADFYRMEPSASSNGSFGGRNDQFNNFSLDGSIFNNPFGLDAATPGGQTDAQPISLDAIEQIQVAVAPYDITQAGFTGAAVNAVTKSGTNAFHGTAYGFFRNENMTGNKVSGDDIFVPDLSQTQYGFSIGGPIIKNKLFFFANFEKDDRSDLGSHYLASGGGATGSNVSRVSKADLEKVSSLLQGIGYETGAYEGFTHKTKSTKGIFKLDWNISQNHRAAFVYNFLDASKDKPAHPLALGRRGPDATTLQFENSGYQINNKIQSFLVELNSSWDNISNKLQVGYTHFDDFRNPFSAPIPPITIGKDGVNYIIAGHEPFSIHNRLDQKVFQFSDNLTIFAGDHTFTFGTSFEKFMFDNSFNLGAYLYEDDRGHLSAFFSTMFTVEAFEEAVNNGFVADAMANAQNVYDNNNTNDTWALAETNVGQFALYGQDEWAVNDNFRLTIGLRIDKPLYFDTSEKIQENIDRNFAVDQTVTYYDENGNPIIFDHTQLPSNKILWSPRVGFNWDVNGDGELQVRGGSGIFTGRLPFVWIGNQVANPNFYFYCISHPKFQFPQVWRNSIGADKRFDNGLIGTVDFAYTKDINGMMVRNYGLKAPSGTLGGVDNRPIYNPATDRVTPYGNNAYVFTNTDVGSSFNATFKVQKHWESGWYAMLAYNFMVSKDASSIEAEISSDAYDRNPAYGNVNKAVESNSLYGDRHRIIGSVNRKFTYGSSDKWATTIGAFMEYAQGGRFSYTYSGDINGDGSALNDLIYIPTSSEVGQMNFADASMANAYEDFIQQDEYLDSHRGEVMEKYAILSPWRSRWDVRILQDFNFKVAGEKTNTIQLSVDILNFGNMLNSNWGVVQLPLNRQAVGITVDGNAPTYYFDTTQKSTFIDDFSLASRWQMQIGLRYIF
ncbi:MAG: TonB-dependent receptor [Bacteroidota bacterium]